MVADNKSRILVADDDKDILDLVTFVLTHSGYEVVGVSDGSAAFAAIKSEQPKLAILDVMMPGMSGIDVLKRVRENEANKNLTIILFSVVTDESVVAAGLAAGASEYIKKPVNLRELLNIVSSFLARSDHG
ncbi:MAG: response regulator [Ilumatobacteraceae bacterium]